MAAQLPKALKTLGSNLWRNLHEPSREPPRKPLFPPLRMQAPPLVSGSGRLVLIQVAAIEPHSSTRKDRIHNECMPSIRCQKTPARQGSPLLTAFVFLPGVRTAGFMALCHAPTIPTVKHEMDNSRQCFRSCIVPGTTRKHADRSLTALQGNGRPPGLS